MSCDGVYILKLHHHAPICMVWQLSHSPAARLYNIWLPVTVSMTSVNYLSYMLWFLLRLCVCFYNEWKALCARWDVLTGC